MRASGRFYVYFTDRSGDQRVQEFRRSSGSPNRADKSTRRQVLSMADPYPNHNGGLLLFGPDGLLYIGTGDGGSGGDPENRAQNLDSLLGKILRIDPRASGSSAYRSPASNPFVGRAGRDEIYAYGLRNPWRFSFDRRNGNLYIGDVGQDAARGDRLRPARRRPRAQLRLELLRGPAPLRRLAQLSRRDAADPPVRAQRRGVLGDGRRRRARPAAARAGRSLRVRRLLRRADPQLPRARGPRDRRSRAQPARRAAQLVR